MKPIHNNLFHKPEYESYWQRRAFNKMFFLLTRLSPGSVGSTLSRDTQSTLLSQLI